MSGIVLGGATATLVGVFNLVPLFISL